MLIIRLAASLSRTSVGPTFDRHPLRGTNNATHVHGERDASGVTLYLKSLDDAELVARAGPVKDSNLVDKNLRVVGGTIVREEGAGSMFGLDHTSNRE